MSELQLTDAELAIVRSRRIARIGSIGGGLLAMFLTNNVATGMLVIAFGDQVTKGVDEFKDSNIPFLLNSLKQTAKNNKVYRTINNFIHRAADHEIEITEEAEDNILNMLESAIPIINDAKSEAKRKMMEDIMVNNAVRSSGVGSYIEALEAMNAIAAMDETAAYLFAKLCQFSETNYTLPEKQGNYSIHEDYFGIRRNLVERGLDRLAKRPNAYNEISFTYDGHHNIAFIFTEPGLVLFDWIKSEANKKANVPAATAP